MQAIEKKPNQIAFFGTIGVWVFIFIFFSFYSLLPHNKPFKTVQIHLESPSQAKASTVSEAPPPASQAMEQAASPAAAPQSSPAQKAVEKPAPKKADSPAKKSPQKAESKTAAKPSSKPAPRPEPKLQKSVDELMAEQRATKTKPKKEFDWSQFDDAEETVSSSTGSAANAVVQSVDAPCPKCGGKVLIKRTKTKRAFYVCENNTNSENSKCDYISWTKPGVNSKTKLKTTKTKVKKKTTKKKTSK